MRKLSPLVLLALFFSLAISSHAAAYLVPWQQFRLVRQRIRESQRPVAECVEIYRTDREPVRFWVQLRIDTRGRVRHVSFDREGPLDWGARYCVRRSLLGLRFPPPEAETRLPIHYVVPAR